MPKITSEATFEGHVEQVLLVKHGFKPAKQEEYDKALCLRPDTVISFIRATQTKKWADYCALIGDKAEASQNILKRIKEVVDKEGTLHVLRKGFEIHGGQHFDLCYFEPTSPAAEESRKLYDENLLHVQRQLKFSEADEKSLDMGIFLNGLPIFTVELKNQISGQNVLNAIKQYKDTRDPKEPLFRFKRCLAHFAVDNAMVYVTAELKQAKTDFLPFNQGDAGGAGNPPSKIGYATGYLWEEVWQKSSILDLVQRFIRVVDVLDDKGKKTSKERQIFPRFHQLTCVRELALDAKKHGSGKRYLTKVSAFIGVMEVAGSSYFDQAPIWSDGVFPVRLPVRLVIEAPLSEAVPIRSLSQKLSFMKNSESNTGWTIHVRTSPRLWNAKDAASVVNALAKRASTDQGRINKLETASKEVTGKTFKKAQFSLNTRVGQVIQKSQRLFEGETAGVIGSYDNAISFNKVTGYSVNVPIASTCKPTATCLKTCYFAVGAPSWSNTLRHQARVFASIKADPNAFAERVALEYDRLGLTFLRWNGGGDLFAESVTVINHLGRIRPDIVLWVVTRIPEFAAQIDELKNVFIHFSLDKHSLPRREQFLRLKPRSSNYFFSYQCEPEELPDAQRLGHSAVLFFDNYHPVGDIKRYKKEIVCPLNGKENISGTCVKCRRCFNGAAVRYEQRSLVSGSFK